MIFSILATQFSNKTLSQGQLIAVGERQRKDPRFYLGNCTLNIPKVKLRFVIRTHILVGDKEMYVDLTVTILQYTHACRIMLLI